jgi:peptide chain release factor subunit 1
MPSETFASQTLGRIAPLDPHGRPVLSIYLDLDPTRFPTPATRDAEVGALLDEARHQDADDDADRVEALLRAQPTIVRGARGLAIFSSVAAGILEAVQLPAPVEPLAVVDTVPWLEPLAAMVTPGDWAVAVVSRTGARLFRGGVGELTEFAACEDEVHGRHAQGGWSQARFQRGVEEEVAAHVRTVAGRLLRAHRRRPFQHLVIVASGELLPVIERNLHSELIDVLSGTVDSDLEHASVDDIALAVAWVIAQAERDGERALIARLEQALGTGGPAAAGLDEVLSTLEQQRVKTLLVPERSSLGAGLCPICGRLSTADDGRCPLDGGIVAEVDAVEHAVEEAARQSAQVVLVRDELDWLSEHGGIAALLRW